MDKRGLKIIGIVGIVGGSAALYASGVTESTIGSIVAGVFVLAGVVVALFKS